MGFADFCFLAWVDLFGVGPAELGVPCAKTGLLMHTIMLIRPRTKKWRGCFAGVCQSDK